MKKIIDNKKEWDKALEIFESVDVYFTYDYFMPFVLNGDGEPRLFFLENEFGFVAYPFLLRDISNLYGNLKKNYFFDISSVYGYGGPLFLMNSTYDISNLMLSFEEEFNSYCMNQNIITQFDRFHPINENQVFFEGYSEVKKISSTIQMDITDYKKTWNNIDSKCRNMIRKSIKMGVEVRIDDDISTLDIFESIYLATMKNNSAKDYYFFNSKFFSNTFLHLNQNAMLVNAYFEEKIISSAIILLGDENIHYHFSGSLLEHRNLQGNSLIISEVARWGSKKGYSKFHLGGGYSSSEDSLFKYKKSFSKLEPLPFYIGKRIANKKVYSKLNELGHRESDYFPKYRGE